MLFHVAKGPGTRTWRRQVPGCSGNLDRNHGIADIIIGRNTRGAHGRGRTATCRTFDDAPVVAAVRTVPCDRPAACGDRATISGRYLTGDILDAFARDAIIASPHSPAQGGLPRSTVRRRVAAAPARRPACPF